MSAYSKDLPEKKIYDLVFLRGFLSAVFWKTAERKNTIKGTRAKQLWTPPPTPCLSRILTLAHQPDHNALRSCYVADWQKGCHGYKKVPLPLKLLGGYSGGELSECFKDAWYHVTRETLEWGLAASGHSRIKCGWVSVVHVHNTHTPFNRIANLY